MKIGIIGLGLLGSAIAERQVAAGHQVHGYDLRPEACKEASKFGVTVHEFAIDVAAECSVILLSLMDSNDRRNLLWGDQDLASALPAGAVLLDTTTGDPDHIEADCKKLSKGGVKLIDVCIAGSSEDVRQQRALALVGGAQNELDTQLPLFRAISKAQFYFDHVGQGIRAKLIFNTVLGLHRLVLAEALGLAKKSGFNLDDILALLMAGAASSAVMDTKGPKMTTGSYEPPVARLAQHAKDVDLILDFAKSKGAEMPVSTLHQRLLSDVLNQGAGDLDNAAIFKRFDT